MKDLELEELVKAEAANLKKFATEYEISNLEASYLDPQNVTGCIYGQCTGSCYSDRAHELIVKCAERVYKQGEEDMSDTFKGAILNGKPTMPEGRYSRHYWSPIELFITKEENIESGNNDKLVAYLKDETQTLEFI